MAQLKWEQVQAPNMKDANMLLSDALNRQTAGGAILAQSFKNLGRQAQDLRDAEFLSQLNQYNNDPIGMAQALQNGTINSYGVSKDALKDAREFAASAATNWASNTKTADEEFLRQQNDKFGEAVVNYKKLQEMGRPEEAAKLAEDYITKHNASSRIFGTPVNYGLLQAQVAAGSNALGWTKLNNDQDYADAQAIENLIYAHTGGVSETDPGTTLDLATINSFMDQFGISGPRRANVAHYVRNIRANRAKPFGAMNQGVPPDPSSSQQQTQEKRKVTRADILDGNYSL